MAEALLYIAVMDICCRCESVKGKTHYQCALCEHYKCWVCSLKCWEWIDKHKGRDMGVFQCLRRGTSRNSADAAGIPLHPQLLDGEKLQLWSATCHWILKSMRVFHLKRSWGLIKWMFLQTNTAKIMFCFFIWCLCSFSITPEFFFPLKVFIGFAGQLEIPDTLHVFLQGYNELQIFINEL